MKNFKTPIVKSVCFFIPYKPLRKKLRKFLLEWSLPGALNFRQLKKHKISPETVLVIEPNDCHGEVVPGYVKYFLDMGFNVDVILHSSVSKDRPLCRMDSPRLRVFALDYYYLQKISEAGRLGEYAHVLLTSGAYYHYSQFEDFSAVKILGLEQMKNLLIVEHDLNNIKNFNETHFLKNNQVIVLGNLPEGIMVNPHCFGNVKITPKNKITNFVVVGGINPKRKNHHLIENAVQTLVRKGYKNFKIKVIGGKVSDISKDLERYIECSKGYVSFPEMYKEMENADFFLTLLDENNPAHERYITTGVTGSAQLVYGFCKPAVIPAKFADFYGFDETNAMIVNNGDLAAAMQDAIDMSEDEYNRIQGNLSTLATAVYSLSFNNLRDIINA